VSTVEAADPPIGQPASTILLDSCVRLPIGGQHERELAIEGSFTVSDGNQHTTVGFSPHSGTTPLTKLAGQVYTSYITLL
jgi:hypothetical protein